MRKFLLSLALALLAGQTASATPVLFLETGFTTTTVVGSGPNVTFSNPNFGGWNITNISGSSDSPTTNNPFGLNLTSVSVICTVSGCDTHPLDVWLSDTTFTAQNTAFESTYQGSVAAISGGRLPSRWPGSVPETYCSNPTVRTDDLAAARPSVPSDRS
jgi:hypothetical protein